MKLPNIDQSVDRIEVPELRIFMTGLTLAFTIPATCYRAIACFGWFSSPDL